MKTHFQKLFDAASAAVTASSDVVDLRSTYCCSIQVVASGSPTATITIEGSNNDVEAYVNGQTIADWSTIGTPQVLSAAGKTITNLDGQGYAWLRVRITAGGTGNISVLYFGKGS